MSFIRAPGSFARSLLAAQTKRFLFPRRGLLLSTKSRNYWLSSVPAEQGPRPKQEKRTLGLRGLREEVKTWAIHLFAQLLPQRPLFRLVLASDAKCAMSVLHLLASKLSAEKEASHFDFHMRTSGLPDCRQHDAALSVRRTALCFHAAVIDITYVRICLKNVDSGVDLIVKSYQENGGPSYSCTGQAVIEILPVSYGKMLRLPQSWAMDRGIDR